MAATVTYTPHPDALAREAAERSEVRSDKSEATAVEILKIAASSANGTNLTDRDIVDRAELMWLWVTTDTWPRPAGAP